MIGNGKVFFRHPIIRHPYWTDIDHKLGLEDIVTLNDPPDYTDIGDIGSTVFRIVVDNQSASDTICGIRHPYGSQSQEE